MNRPTLVNHEDLLAKKDNYLAFANMTEEDIRTNWIDTVDVYIEDLAAMEYQQDLPLWCKIIFRYRNSYRNPIVMSQGVTNKSRLLSPYKLQYWEEGSNIDFFFWIACSIDKHTLQKLTGFIDEDAIMRQAQQTCVQLFYKCPVANQQNMVNVFNQTQQQPEIDRYDEQRRVLDQMMKDNYPKTYRESNDETVDETDSD